MKYQAFSGHISRRGVAEPGGMVYNVTMSDYRKILLFLLLFPAGIVNALETEAGSTSNYQLGVGDRVRIQVYNEEDLYLETRVSDTGIISYPFLGNIEKRIGVDPGITDPGSSPILFSVISRYWA